MAGALRLHFVRHGRTVLNEQRRVQGWIDSPMTDRGLRSVHALAVELETVPLTAAYSSDSGRAVITAEEILRLHPAVQLHQDRRLREMSFGRFEAEPEAEFFDKHEPLALFDRIRQGSFAGLEGGERSADYMQRLRSVLATLRANHPGGDVLVVTHSITLFMLLAELGVVVPEEIPNATVVTAEFTAGSSTPEIRRDGKVLATEAG